MELAEPLLFDRTAMREGAIALMNIKTIERILLGEAYHEAIAQYFRRDRCERDHGLRLVAADDRLLVGKFLRRMQAAVEQDLDIL